MKIIYAYFVKIFMVLEKFSNKVKFFLKFMFYMIFTHSEKVTNKLFTRKIAERSEAYRL